MTQPINYNEVVLVDSFDNVLGAMEKLEAHEKGVLHRAFSVFLFNDQGEMLIQKRADSKYHSAGLWSNACCSHPAPNESLEEAAERRLMEELSLKAAVQPVFSFEYKVIFENHLIENELDHVLVGKSNELGWLNPEEVSELKFIAVPKLNQEIENHPEQFSAWFKLIMLNHWEKISTNLAQHKFQKA